jgi:tetratricopeptide (TPR) repeat protein
MSRFFVSMVLAIMSFSSGQAAGTKVAVCEERWQRIYTMNDSGGGNHDVAALLKDWLAMEPLCKGSGIYEFRLATLYLALEQPQAALRTIEKFPALPEQYAKSVPFMRLRVQLTLLKDQRPIPRDKILALKPEYVAALEKDQDSPTAYEEASNYMLMIGDDRSAVSYAERSLQLDANQWDPNRTLAIAFMHLGEYAKSVFAGRRAQEIRNVLIADPEFMYAVAKSYAGVGNITVAEKTLQILVNAKPDEHNTEAWRETINFLAEQVRAGNRKN